MQPDAIEISEVLKGIRRGIEDRIAELQQLLNLNQPDSKQPMSTFDIWELAALQGDLIGMKNLAEEQHSQGEYMDAVWFYKVSIGYKIRMHSAEQQYIQTAKPKYNWNDIHSIVKALALKGFPDTSDTNEPLVDSGYCLLEDKLGLAEAYEAAGEMNFAVRVYQQLADYTNDPNIHSYCANKIEELSTEFKVLEDPAAELEERKMDGIRKLIDAGDYAGATGRLNQLIKKDRNNPVLLELLGDVFAKRDLNDRAKEYYKSAGQALLAAGKRGELKRIKEKHDSL